MATIELDQQRFGEVVTSPGIVFVDFWAEWCGPCRMFGPIFEEASNKDTDIIFAKVPEVDPISQVILDSVLQAMDEVHSLMSREKGLAGMAFGEMRRPPLPVTAPDVKTAVGAL